MKKLNTHSLLAVLSVVLMVTACGKNMSMQVPNTTKLKNLTNAKTVAADATVVRTRLPSADAITGDFEALSAFDVANKDNVISPTATLVRRAILHVEPKEAVSKISMLDVILDHAKIDDVKNVKICLLKDCRSLTAFIADPSATTIQFDLRKVFALDTKTDAEVMDWINSNTTAFADPGYRKMIISFEGITSIDCGDIVYTTETNDKLPKDFASAPTCFENGETDLYTPGIAGPNEKPIVGVNATAPAATTPDATTTTPSTTTPTTTTPAPTTSTDTTIQPKINTADTSLQSVPTIQTTTKTTTTNTSGVSNTPECADGLVYVTTKDAKGCYAQGSCNAGSVDVLGNCILLSDINDSISSN